MHTNGNCDSSCYVRLLCRDAVKFNSLFNIRGIYYGQEQEYSSNKSNYLFLNCCISLWAYRYSNDVGGVECFFVLSAYYLTKKVLANRRDNISVTKTMLHRIKRIYPMYSVVIVLAALRVFVKKRTVDICDLLIHALFLQNYNWMITGYTSELQPYTAHTWTLCIDISMYFVLIILYKFLKSRKCMIYGNIGLMICAAVYRIFTTYIIGDPMIVSLFPLAHADAYAVGSMLAIREDGRAKSKNSLIAFMPIGLILIFSSVFVTAKLANVSFGEGYTLYKTSENYLNHWYTCNIYFFISLFFVGVLGLLPLIKQANSIVFRILSLCGDYSYTAYLLHWPIRAIMLHFVEKNAFAACVNILVSLLGAYVLEHTFSLVRRTVANFKPLKQ